MLYVARNYRVNVVFTGKPHNIAVYSTAAAHDNARQRLLFRVLCAELHAVEVEHALAMLRKSLRCEKQRHFAYHAVFSVKITRDLELQQLHKRCIYAVFRNVEIRVHSDSANPVLNEVVHNAPFGNLLQAVENHGVVRNDKVCTLFKRFFNHRVGDVKTSTNSRDFNVRVADKQTHVIVALGGFKRSKLR